MKIIHTGKASPQAIMQRDAQLLASLHGENDPILHDYEWSSEAATYGYFIDPYTFLRKDVVERRGLVLAKRPTGGGIILHLCDLAFSFLLPATHPAYSQNTLNNYSYVNNIVIEVLQQFLGEKKDLQLLSEEPQNFRERCRHFCLAKPTKYDVMLSGRKVGGAAQRRTKDGFLHQGSINIGSVPRDYLEDIIKDDNVIDAMTRNSCSLLGDNWTLHRLREARTEIRQLLQEKRLLFP